MKILICDTIHEDGVRMLKDAGFEVELDTEISPEMLVQKIGAYDGMVVRSRTKVTKDVLNAAKNLKAIARAGVGLDNVDREYAKEKCIEVYNSPEAPSNAVAELTIGLMLSMARMITKADAGMKQYKWEKNSLTGYEIQGKTLGVIGLGQIGFLVAKKAKCLGMKVLVYNRAMERKRQLLEEAKAEEATLERVYSESDYITVHLPLNSETKNMINTEQFMKMKNGVYIINTARGGIIKESALKAALDSGKVKAAALDVFEQEPTQDKDLVGRANVICTPHIGAGSEEAQVGNSTIVAEKLIKFFKP
ncbi:hydroxyacid dehydrogenase [Candidatus Bathyarchaeota archaeon]|nr:hydroxyacid dehydrogenase [Candidatus Bathyarchaeota archaeon]